MHLVEVHLFEELHRLLKLRVGLARKAHDHIGRDGRLVVVPAKEPHALHEFLRRVVAVHAPERGIAAALQGQVKVRADLRHGRDPPDKRFRHDARLQGTEADPLDSGDFPDPVHEIQKKASGFDGVEPDRVRLRVPLKAVGADMDPGEHDLPDALLCDLLHFPDDFAGPSAPDPAPGIGDYAVGAELIAPVLDFDKGACVAGRFELHVLVFGPVREVGQGPSAQGAPREIVAGGLSLFELQKELVEKLRDPGLVVVSDREVDGLVRPDPLRVRLHVAAHGDDHRVRIRLFGLVDHLAALPVRDIGDRAGVDHVHFRLLLKRNGNIAVLLHLLPHYVQFIIVYFASEVVKSYTFQSFSSLFFSPYDIDFSHARIYY